MYADNVRHTISGLEHVLNDLKNHFREIHNKKRLGKSQVFFY